MRVRTSGPSSACQMWNEPLQRLEVVGGREVIDERQRRRHPARRRLVARVAQQRVQPDDLPGATLDATYGVGEQGGVAAVEPVAEYDDHGLAARARRQIALVEPGEAFADARPSR